MPFTNGTDRPITWASFNSKEGVFVVKEKDEKKTYSQVRDIFINGVSIEEDTYEGTLVRKLRVRASDANGDVSITFNLAASVTAKLIALLDAADLGAPLGISARLYKAGTSPKFLKGEVLSRDLVLVSVFQNGGYVYPKETPPKAAMVRVGNKEVADTSARDAWVETKVAELQAKLKSRNLAEPPIAGAADVEDDLDDIPF